MAGHTLVPRDAPDPEGDRRFAERAFPLLEPLEWTGERHRGGYGVRNPGSVTISLGLVFGPWDPFVSEPRLAVTVGTEMPMDVADEHAPFLMRPYLVATREDLVGPSRGEDAPARFTTDVEIDGRRCSFDCLGRRQRWVGHGSWASFQVFLHAIAIDPDRVRLRVAEHIPPE